MTRIIIADDVEILRKNMYKQLSKEEDFNVVYAASSGFEAYEKAIELIPDIVIMDMEMEQVNSGIIYSRKIFSVLPNIKIIILTVHEEESLILDAFGAGIVDYIIKEPSCKNLINHIRKVIDNMIVFDFKVNKVIHNEFMKLKNERIGINSLYRTFIQLTPAEREIIKLLYQGKKIKEIADCRFVEPITIKKQVTNILKKFGVKRTKEIISLINEMNATDLLFP